VLNNNSFQGVLSSVVSKKVVNVWRRAKMLGIDLDREKTILLFHLKMSGQLIYQGRASKIKGEEKFIGGHPTADMGAQMPVRSTRVIFSFSDGSKLYFNDQRKFGWVRVVDSSQITVSSLFEKLGPEPLEKGFTWEVLK